MSAESVIREDDREAVALEERVWVRTTFACNNRCVFCLDAHLRTPFHRPEAEVIEEIRRRAKPGARLIVSGGEASIHPGFLRFLQAGREAGYAWIQTITNGRRFSNERFARAAVLAGLNEATFSLHGHTAELHDRLTGTPGGFEQALQGLANLHASGRVVLSVDIVLNGANIAVLDDILRFYRARGIHEFDLLHIQPFGNAWRTPQRSWLFYDRTAARAPLARALTEARAVGDIVWTNRLPPADLEGFEEFIQDPHKLLDEIHGRRAEFAEMTAKHAPLRCADARCAYCHVETFCRAFEAANTALARKPLRGAAQTAAARGFAEASVRLDANGHLQSGVEEQAMWRVLAEQPLRALRLTAMKDEHALALYTRAPEHLRAIPWTFDIETGFTRPPAGVTRVSRHPSQAERLLAAGVPLEIPLDTAHADWLVRVWPSWAERPDLTLRLPSAETLSEVRRRLPLLAPLLGTLRRGTVPFVNIPPCLHPRGIPAAFTLEAEALTPNGLDPMAFARVFIREHMPTHAHACSGCPHEDTCPGLHLNVLRAQGLALLGWRHDKA